jgi:hypothetical protein
MAKRIEELTIAIIVQTRVLFFSTLQVVIKTNVCVTRIKKAIRAVAIFIFATPGVNHTGSQATFGRQA